MGADVPAPPPFRNRRTFLAAARRSASLGRPRPSGGFPRPSPALHRGISAGRTQRPVGAHRGARHRRTAEALGGGREPRRRQWRDRRGLGRQGTTRRQRLHAGLERLDDGGARAQPQSVLRRAHRLRRGGARRHKPDAAGCATRPAGQERERASGPRPQPAGQTQWRLGRRRWRHPSGARALQVDGPSRHRARALQGRRSGHGRPHGKPGRHLFRRSLHGAAARQGGQAAGSRPDVADAFGAAAPDIPTIAESGLPGYEAAISYGIFLPPGAAPALVDRLHAAVDSTIRSPEIAQKFIELGADPQFGTPAQFAAYVADDYAKWARLAKEAGLKAE